MNDRGTSETIVTAEHFQEKREPVFRPKNAARQKDWSTFSFHRTECGPPQR
jgi:hypothetical protein